MAARRAVPHTKAPVLASLTLMEKGELLDQLLSLQPQLLEQVEEMARLRLDRPQRDLIAGDVESALALDIDELNGRAGYHRGRGYVDPGEAAAEILDEALQSFRDDLTRRAKLGLTAGATEIAVGILCGLYESRDGGSETLLEYTPDYAIERAGEVIDDCAKLGVSPPVDDLLDLMPAWSRLLHSRNR